MAIKFACPSCGRALQVRDEFAGKQAECPSCGEVSLVPQGAPEPTQPERVTPRPMATTEIAVSLCAASCIVYAISFALPMFDGGPGGCMHFGFRGQVYGYHAFLGAMLILLGGAPFWLPNPAFWIGVSNFSKKRYGRAFGWALAALVLGLTPLFELCSSSTVPAWRTDSTSHVWLTNFSGYYAWMASFALFALASFVARRTTTVAGKG